MDLKVPLVTPKVNILVFAPTHIQYQGQLFLSNVDDSWFIQLYKRRKRGPQAKQQP